MISESEELLHGYPFSSFRADVFYVVLSGLNGVFLILQTEYQKETRICISNEIDIRQY